MQLALYWPQVPASLSTINLPILTTFALFAAMAAAQPGPAATGTIEGTTFGAAHQPLPNTSLTMLPIPGPASRTDQINNTYTVESDSLGRFSIDGVYPGSYAVLAQHADYSPSYINIGAPNTPIAATVTVAAGQHVTGVEIQLTPMTVLSGRVTDENGDPLPGVTVRPMVVDNFLNGRRHLMIQGGGVQTDADGRYTMPVYSAHWFLRFIPAKSGEPGTSYETSYAATYFPGVRDVSLASGFDTVGQPISELNVRMERLRVYHVRGKITGPLAQTANPDLRILPWEETGSLRPSVVDEGRPLAPDGTFDIAGLTAGNWTLILCQYGKPGSLGRQKVRISDADLDDIVIPSQPPAEFRGSVREIPDQSVRQTISKPLVVALTPLEALLTSAAALVLLPDPAKTSGFSFRTVEAGMYRVDVTAPPGTYVKSLKLNGQDCLETGIDLTSGAASAGVMQIVLSTAAGRLSGTVTNPDGTAFTSATVTLLPDRLPGSLDRPELRPVTIADATGHFTLTGIAPGSYHVYAWERLDEVTAPAVARNAIHFPDPQFPRLFDNFGAAVMIAENDSKQVSLSTISAARLSDELRRHR